MKRKPSKAARQAAKRIRNTKSELLDTITSLHHTILEQYDENARTTKTYFEGLTVRRQEHDLTMLRIRMVLIIRRQIEKRLRVAIGELVAFYEVPRHSGFLTTEVLRIAEIRELCK